MALGRGCRRRGTFSYEDPAHAWSSGQTDQVTAHGLVTAAEASGLTYVDVPAATAILDRFLHHAELITITGKSDRLKGQAKKASPGAKMAPPDDHACEAEGQ